LTSLDPVSAPLHGLQLVEASAGTGKTHNIGHYWLRLLLDGLRVDQVLVVTFTRAATKELRDRLRSRLHLACGGLRRKRLPPERDLARLLQPSLEQPQHLALLERALRDFDLAPIHTIHSFCQRALQRWAFESQALFDTSFESDQDPLYLELARDFWTERLIDAHRLPITALQEAGISPESLAELARVADRWPDLKLLPGPAKTDLDHALRRYANAFAPAREQWKRYAHVVAKVLRDKRVINQRQLGPRRLEPLLEDLGAFFWPEQPSWASLPAHFRLLTPAGLASCTKKGWTPPRHRFFARCDALLLSGQALERQLEAWQTQFQRAFFETARRELPARRRRRGVLSYNDLVRQLASALASPGGETLAQALRHQHPAALIDEFQDTDRAQYEVFRRVYSRPEDRLFLIGDPKQAIYAFRGADIQAYLHAVESAGARRGQLDVNWRSDGGLVRAINTLFARVGQPFGYEGIGFEPVAAQHEERCGTWPVDGQEPFQIRFIPRTGKGKRNAIASSWHRRGLPRAVAGEVARLLSSQASIPDDRGGQRALQPRDVAVLTRTHRQLEELEQALAAVGVVSVRANDASVFTTEEAHQLAQLLTAIADPKDEARVRAALCTDILGLDGCQLAALLEGQEELETDWDSWLLRLRQWREIWRDQGFIQLFQSVLDHEGLLTRLLARPGGERRLTNLRHLAELLQTMAEGEQLGIQGLLTRLSQLRQGQLNAGDEAQLRLESDEQAVALSTVHGAKGLEYPVVFCPYLWAEITDDQYFYDEQGRLCRHLGQPSQAQQEAAQQRSWREAMRLLYVALTRARHRCVICWGAFYDRQHACLGALLHPPPGDEPPDRARLKAHMRGLDDQAMRGDLDQLAASSAGSIGWSLLEERPQDRCQRPSPAAETLRARRFTGRLDPLWRTSSFSGLVSKAEEGLDPEELFAPEHDDAPPARAAAGAAPPAVPAAHPPQAHQACLLADFRGGRRAGTMLHEVLERLDFPRVGGPHMLQVAAERLRFFGYDGERWSQPVAQALRSVLATPLDPGLPGFHLGQLTRAQRADELEFLLPVAPGGGALGARILARALATAPDADLPPAAIARVGELGFAALKGYLCGFIDLVFEHQGRFYLADYKSNLLGPEIRHYDRSAMAHEMQQADYLLQLHLYCAALHLHLQRRLPGYDYDSGFGGAYYLFLRGMRPDCGPEYGVFRTRPPRQRIEAICAALSDPRAGGAP